MRSASLPQASVNCAVLRANTPQNARFVVNSFLTYGNTDIVGPDGGRWLPHFQPVYYQDRVWVLKVQP
jgi:hypothetical protein